MHEATYDSVGTLTFCFDTTAYTAPGTVTFAARQGASASPSTERPAPVRNAPEDPNGMLRLNPREDPRLMSAIDEHIRADKAFRIKARFKSSHTGEITSWDITVNVQRVNDISDSTTRQFTFYSGFSSEYPVGAIDLTKC